jgi:hypothetical protein
MRRLLLNCATEFGIGLAFSSAHPFGRVFAIIIPALVLRNQSRTAAYLAAMCYYAGALWPVVPGARNFFGADVSLLTAFALWMAACLLLASPWLMVWSLNRSQFWWRAPCGLASGVIPPLGIIGWASPLTVAGLLFPGTCWWGWAACAVVSGGLAAYPRSAATLLALTSIICNTMCKPVAQSPAGWVAVNTCFGAIAHGSASVIAEFTAAQSIQEAALTTKATVILFPETVVPTWTAATDAFWQPTFQRLRSDGKIAIVGARLPVPGADAGISSVGEISRALAVLHGKVASGPVPGRSPDFLYDNAVVIRGSETTIFRQRIPVPIAMWKPFGNVGARLHLFEPGIVMIGKRRAAFVICYEQLLVWPTLTSLLQRPDILVAVANDYWATGTAIPAQQRICMRSWARLFDLPLLSATNF